MEWDRFLNYAFWACCIAGIMFSNAANLHLIPEQKNTFGILFWRKKVEFTPKGWRFRQIAVALSYLGVAIELGLWLAQ
jgi:hypothetical protein